MSRRTALILSGALSLALLVFLSAIDPSTLGDGRASIVEFEFAADEERAEEITAGWGEDGRDRARLSLRVDFVYLIAYGLFFTLAAAATRDWAAHRGRSRLAALGAFAVPAAAAGASFDAIENVCLLVALEGRGGDLAPLLGAVCAGLKFFFTITAILYVLAGLVARLRDRRRA